MPNQKTIEKELKDIVSKEKEALNDMYGDILRKLKNERENLQKDLKNEYENARKYVKKNPESGLGIAVAGGIIAGIVISKLISR